jgi:hypothetical protein
MWKNVVERCRPQMTILRIRIACWITTARHTLTVYNTYCFSTATVVYRTRRNVTLNVHYCYLNRKLNCGFTCFKTNSILSRCKLPSILWNKQYCTPILNSLLLLKCQLYRAYRTPVLKTFSFCKTSFAGERVCFDRYEGTDIRSMMRREISMLYLSSFLRVITMPTREFSSI